MGAKRTLRIIEAPAPSTPAPSPPVLTRRRPRVYAEWAALRRWGKLPSRERAVAGYALRSAREAAGLTQRGLAVRLGVTQQAVAQAERWAANPTVELCSRWADACGRSIRLRFDPAVTGTTVRAGWRDSAGRR